MTAFRVGSIFAGIGGFDLGFERAGFEVAWQVEADPFCLDLLRRRFPNAKRFSDVRSFRPREAEPISVLVGGPPCQPVSLAGSRLGEADERFLWPDALRILEESGAAVAVFENPLGFRTCGMGSVLARLAELGFDAEWATLRVSDFGGPHRRARIFLIATDADRYRRDERTRDRFFDSLQGSTPTLARCGHDSPDADGDGRASEWFEKYFRQRGAPGFVADRRDQWRRWSRTIGYATGAPFPVLRGMDDEFPGRVDRLRALGNSVAPLLIEAIARKLRKDLE